MPYKSSTTTTNRGTAAEATQSRLAAATKIHGDGDFGGTLNTSPVHADQAYLPLPIELLTDCDMTDDLIPSRDQSGLFPTFNMNPVSNHETSQNGGVKLSISSRRRQSSIPSAKLFAGPRALDLQNNQRSVGGKSLHSLGSNRNTSTITGPNPYTSELSIEDISQFSFASIDPTNTVPKHRSKEEEPSHGGSFVEPKFDFDAFHDNIVANSPRLDTFPLPGLPSQFDVPEVPEVPKLESRRYPNQPTIPVPTRKISAAGSIGRKGSTASTASRLSISKLDPMSQTAVTTSILRGRRQNFPPNAFNNNPAPAPTAKAPRKSVGPGTFTMPDMGEQVDVKRRPSVNGRKSSTETSQSSTSGRGTKRGSESSREASKSPSTIRVKSMYGGTRQTTKDLFTPVKTPEGLRTTSTNVLSTPNRRSGTPGRTTTPGGATSRRQSVATGLGARTISPTDARRLKRMSMVPPAPPLPASRISQAPPTPQPDLSLATLPQPTTPNTGQRKSMTPSSSRTTPDPNRKSYSSGQSLSSNTTYGSMRNSAPAIVKLAQPNTSSSRLPTPKPRVETGNSPTGEEIPPVPAIPKSYESPASEVDQPFFSARSSSLQQLDTPISENSIGIAAAEAFAKLNIPDDFNDSLLFAEQDYFRTQPATKLDDIGISGRVPPLGLLPLTATTANKIKEFKHSSSVRSATPTEDHHKIKTPSTPMTASKAALFTRGDRANETNQSKVIRSNTSHFVVRSAGQGSHERLSPNVPVFTFETDTSGHRSVSPYLSSSAPKDSQEYPSYMRPNFTTELRRTGTQARPNGPRAPSYSISTKINEDTPGSGNSPATSGTASTSSLQRAFSKQVSDNKTTELPKTSQDVDNYDSMPPPKLPASATWNNLSTKPASPTQKSSFFKSRRKTSTSSGNTLANFGIDRKESNDSNKGQGTIGRPSIDSMRSFKLQPSKSGSMLSSAPSVKVVPARAQEAELDRDDMVAEDEMKKLASKRKDFESAARQLDSLRARARAADRLSPNAALHTIDLNIFERGEIVDFPDIFFTGTKKARKIVGDLASSASNFGYDDDRGDYNIVEGDHLAYRYEVVDVLGKGSFGQVVRCVDHKTGILVAIKIIRNKKRFHQQALVEVEILQKLKEWDPEKKHNVVNFDQSFYFRGHLCISTDLLNMNLYEFIKAHDFRGFSLKLIRRFTKQMLSSLVLLHGKKVIHCDLKPENILLAHPAHSEIKVIDFGSSCFENEKVYTYIQSRFYRSPEVILGMSYGMPIDMWSLGCILAELYTGYPIFPGENEQEQLACIMEIFGPPEKHLIEKSSRKKLFFDSLGKPRLTVSSKGRRRRPSSKDLRSVLKCDDEAFLDFIGRCLRWDPSRRMNPHEATKHEFITGVKPSQISARKHIANALSTPLKRGNSLATAASGRPLPQPPSSSLKPMVGIRQEPLAASPNKPGPRRQSNATTLHVVSQAKRASHTAMNSSSNSSSSRLNFNQRTGSSRNDLATAAAAASLLK